MDQHVGPGLGVEEGAGENQAVRRFSLIDVKCPDCKTVRREPDFNLPLDILDATSLQAIYAEVDLRSNHQNIRILTLFPGTLDDEVRCQLTLAPLEDSPTFIALSYCWGDATSRRSIKVNGYQVLVTQSLEAALRHMRHSGNRVSAWADAICINQSDPVEKSAQVAMMGDIYARGKRPRDMFQLFRRVC
jgi:Heterokaryon incompatibility protein (HET)